MTASNCICNGGIRMTCPDHGGIATKLLEESEARSRSWSVSIDDEFKRDREVIDAATPGPWTSGPVPPQGMPRSHTRFVVAHLAGSVVYQATNEPSHGVPSSIDAAMIARARTLLPAALRELKAAREELARLKLVCQDYRNQRGVAWSDSDEQRDERDKSDGLADFLAAERDSLRAQLAASERARHEAEQLAESRFTWAQQVAERIAAFIDADTKRLADSYAQPSAFGQQLAIDIRAGAWRTKGDASK